MSSGMESKPGPGAAEHYMAHCSADAYRYDHIQCACGAKFRGGDVLKRFEEHVASRLPAPSPDCQLAWIREQERLGVEVLELDAPSPEPSAAAEGVEARIARKVAELRASAAADAGAGERDELTNDERHAMWENMQRWKRTPSAEAGDALSSEDLDEYPVINMLHFDGGGMEYVDPDNVASYAEHMRSLLRAALAAQAQAEAERDAAKRLVYQSEHENEIEYKRVTQQRDEAWQEAQGVRDRWNMLEQRAETAEAKLADARKAYEDRGRVGAQMANVLYNLAQTSKCEGNVNLFRDLYKQWDALSRPTTKEPDHATT